MRTGRTSAAASGLRQLSALWTSPPQDPEQLRYLTSGSRGLSDRRLLDALLRLVSDTTAPSRHRRAALDVTVSYHSPRWFVRPQAWDSTTHVPSSGSMSHESTVASADPDRLIRRMARALAHFHAASPAKPAGGPDD